MEHYHKNHLENYKGYSRCSRYSQLGLTHAQLESALKNDFILFESIFRVGISFSTVCISAAKDLVAGMVLYQLMKQYTILHPTMGERKTCKTCVRDEHTWVFYKDLADVCCDKLYITKSQCVTAIIELCSADLIITNFTKTHTPYIRPNWSIFVLLISEINNLNIIDFT